MTQSPDAFLSGHQSSMETLMRATRCFLLGFLLGTAAVILAAQVQSASAQRGVMIAQAPAPAPPAEADPNAQKKKEPGQHPPGAPQQRPGGPAAHPPAVQGQPPAQRP